MKIVVLFGPLGFGVGQRKDKHLFRSNFVRFGRFCESQKRFLNVTACANDVEIDQIEIIVCIIIVNIQSILDGHVLLLSTIVARRRVVRWRFFVNETCGTLLQSFCIAHIITAQ